MLSENTIRILKESNPWWSGKEADAPKYKRQLFATLQNYMKMKQILAVVGLRRVGKTTLMIQLINDLLKKGTSGKNILFFSFDEVISKENDILSNIIRYFEGISPEGKKYIFFDEVQKVAYWEEALKRFYDIHDIKGDFKFVVSGSASLQIKKSKESLAGRIFDFVLEPLSFSEYLSLSSVIFEKPAAEFNGFSKSYDSMLSEKEKFEHMFKEYLFKGGFPELAGISDADAIRKYIKNSVVEKIVYEDIAAVFNVRQKDLLINLLLYACKETSQMFEISNLADTMKASPGTIGTHIFYLQNSFLTDILFNFSRSSSKMFRKKKKIHIAHTSIAFALLNYDISLLDTENIGKYVETAVMQHAKAFEGTLYFWRDAQKREVDVVVDFSDAAIPIEVKYKNNITASDLSGIIAFSRKNKSKDKRAFVVTKDILKQETIKGVELTFVPAWLFLLAF